METRLVTGPIQGIELSLLCALPWFLLCSNDIDYNSSVTVLLRILGYSFRAGAGANYGHWVNVVSAQMWTDVPWSTLHEVFLSFVKQDFLKYTSIAYHIETLLSAWRCQRLPQTHLCSQSRALNINLMASTFAFLTALLMQQLPCLSHSAKKRSYLRMWERESARLIWQAEFAQRAASARKRAMSKDVYFR